MCEILKTIERVKRIDRNVAALVKPKHNPVRLKVGLVSEQTKPVTKTPQFQRKFKGESIVIVTMTNSQACTVTVAFKDKKGNDAKVDGTPEWMTDNSEVLALEPAADGMSVKVSAVGPVSTASLTLKADADLGDGVTEIGGSLDFEIVGGQAVTVELTAGTPEEQA